MMPFSHPYQPLYANIGCRGIPTAFSLLPPFRQLWIEYLVDKTAFKSVHTAMVEIYGKDYHLYEGP